MKYLLTLATAIACATGAVAQTAIPRALAVAADGTILVGTSSPGSNGVMQMKITGYNQDGTFRGSLVRSIAASTPLIMQMAATEGSAAVMTGSGGDASSPEDIVTFGFDVSQIVSVNEPGMPNVFSLSPAYPNPVAGGIATVQFETAQSMAVRLSIRDLTGREVQLVDDGVLPSGKYERTIATASLDAGSYFVVFESPHGTLTKKLLIVR